MVRLYMRHRRTGALVFQGVRCASRAECWAHRHEAAERRREAAKKRNAKPADLPLKPLHEPLGGRCRWCGEAIYRKAKDGRIVVDRRRGWHEGREVDPRAFPEPRCVQEYNAQAFTFRGAIFRRDRGVCASCGRDVHAELELWEQQMRLIRGEWSAMREAVWDRDEPGGWLDKIRPLQDGEQAAVNRFLREHPRPEWHADHVVPLEDGGEHLLANGQTLCVPCHTVKTAAENEARAARRREAAA